MKGMIKYEWNRKRAIRCESNTHTHTHTHEYSSKREKDWTGNKATTFVQLGASNHSQGEREANDFYATHPLSLKIFLDKLNEDKIELHSNIWECACGMGHLSKVLEEKGYNVLSTDLIDRGYGTSGIDFLKAPNGWNGDILTNPPYKYAKEFVEKGLEAVTPRKICNYVFENTIFRGKRKI